MLALTLALGFTGCAAAPGRNPFQEATPGATSLTIIVENQGFNSVRVYAMTPQGTRSLGSVSGNSTHQSTLEWRQTDQIRFRLDVFTGGNYNTAPIQASPGDKVQLVIPTNPGNSYITKR